METVTMKVMIIAMVFSLSIGLVGCKEGASEKSLTASPDITQPNLLNPDKPAPIIVGETDPVDVEAGDYRMPGLQHATLGGDVMLFSGSNYERATWVNGDAFIEKGTWRLTQTITITDSGSPDLPDTHTYTNYVEFTPTQFIPSNCGTSTAPYQMKYEYESNGSVLTQHIWLDQMDSGDTITQAFGWPYPTSWVESNKTPACI